VEDLVVILDGEAVDNSKDFGEMLFVGLGGDEKVINHVDELKIGERSVVDDSAVGCRECVSGEVV
jgi:hypothetical protein